MEILLLLAISYLAGRGTSTAKSPAPGPTAHDKTVREIAAGKPLPESVRAKIQNGHPPEQPEQPLGIPAAFGRRAARIGATASAHTTEWQRAFRAAARTEYVTAKTRSGDKIRARKLARHLRKEARKRERDLMKRVPPPPQHPPSIPAPAGGDADTAKPEHAPAAQEPPQSPPETEGAGTPSPAAGPAAEGPTPPLVTPPRDIAQEWSDGKAEERRDQEQRKRREDLEDQDRAQDEADREAARRALLNATQPPPPTLVVLPGGRPATRPTGAQPLALQIGEVTSLDDLLNALTHIASFTIASQQEADVIARDDRALAAQLEQMEASLAGLEVDSETLGQIASLRELVTTNARQAEEYSVAASETADHAKRAAGVALARHGGIAEAVRESPVEAPATGSYYES